MIPRLFLRCREAVLRAYNRRGWRIDRRTDNLTTKHEFIVRFTYLRRAFKLIPILLIYQLSLRKYTLYIHGTWKPTK